jgi:hypothetical protein
VPALVEVIKGYTTHERTLLEDDRPRARASTRRRRAA